MNDGDMGISTATRTRNGHSGLGIASFAIGLLTITGLLASLVVIASESAASGGHLDPHSAIAIGTGLIILLTGVLGLIATGLVIAGVMQRMRQRVFSILGLCFNGPVVLLVLILFIIGIAKN